MVLDVVLADEVRDVGRVVDGLFAVAVDGGVDKVLYARLEGRVDEGDALGLLDDGAVSAEFRGLLSHVSTYVCAHF